MSELPAQLSEALRGWGDNPVAIELFSSGETVPVGASELRRRVREMIAALSREGVRRDDIVALFLENSIDYVTLILALLEMRAVPLFAKLEYRRTELSTLFRDLDPDAVIIESSYLHVIEPHLSGQGVIIREVASAGKSTLRPVVPVERHHAEAGFADLATSINCTYRGDGELLGSIATEAQYRLGAKVLQDGLQGCRGESMLFPLPLSHIFSLVGCLFVPLFQGMTGILARTVHPRLIFGALETLHVEHVTAVPEIYRLLLRSGKDTQRFPALRTFVSGGSVLHAREYDELTEAFSLEVLHGYGLTEFTPVSRNSRGDARRGTIGPVCEGVDVRIDNPDSTGSGEILLRSDALCAGYYNRPQVTRRAFRDGWFHTGDRGRFRETHLVFEGEIKETRKVNGVMVDLQEVRRAVLAASTAEDATVFLEGNAITALLKIPESVDIDKEEKRLRHVLVHQIAPYKVPRRIARID